MTCQHYNLPYLHLMKITKTFCPVSKGSPHQIKDQLEHLVSVHDLFYLPKSKGFLSYRFKLTLTSIFVQNSKFQVSYSSQDYYTAFSMPSKRLPGIIEIFSESVISHVCELFFTQLFNHVVLCVSSFSASITRKDRHTTCD